MDFKTPKQKTFRKIDGYLVPLEKFEKRKREMKNDVIAVVVFFLILAAFYAGTIFQRN